MAKPFHVDICQVIAELDCRLWLPDWCGTRGILAFKLTYEGWYNTPHSVIDVLLVDPRS